MLYPIFVDLLGKRCVVVGAGTVAERRITGLLDCGATITVVAPGATPVIKTLADAGKVRWVRDHFVERHLDQAFLVVAATNNEATNRAVAEVADKENVLVCRADLGPNGNFLTAASINRGAIQIAVTTGGASPTLASVIKSRIEAAFGTEWANWVNLLSSIRASLQNIGTETERRNAVSKILDNKGIEAFVVSGDIGSAEKAALECISSYLA
jgi:precorrin-2 dehydrogenase / sirohydrochlorin ferrochelatase